MPGNSFGQSFRITSFGESHGKAVGVVVDGVTPGVELNENDIQKDLDRRKPGQSSLTTSRVEPDTVHIMSGVFEGKTMGTPLLLVLHNRDVRSDDYLAIEDLFRPGHADYTYFHKYGIRDYRGSGRASGRETAARVAAGAVARKLLSRRGVSVLAYTAAIGGIACRSFQPDQVEKNPLRACDPEAAKDMIEMLGRVKGQNDSLGGIVECRANGVPPGLGEPVFDKLDADLAKGMLSIGAVKGIEFGAGFQSAAMKGSEHNDWMDSDGFLSNHAGGVLGGLSSGQEIIFRLAVKPTSSIAVRQKTVKIDGGETEIRTEGRHDSCICPRIVPVVEAMTALVLEDHFKRQGAMLA